MNNLNIRFPTPCTLFAPSNAAFEKVETELKEIDKDKEKREALVKTHILSGRLLLSSIEKDTTIKVKNENGKLIPIERSAENKFSIGDTNVVPSDIESVLNGGLIYLIDTVMLVKEGT